jgi:signal transduction histidine kinase
LRGARKLAGASLGSIQYWVTACAVAHRNMNQINTLDPQQLAQAFQVFNLASSDLCLAYEELRQQALVLTQELALANGELRRQFEEKEALRESVQRRERLAAMGEMAARLAHQLRTPLATALLYAAQLGEPALPAAERARFAGRTVDRLRHLERLIEDMLLFVRGVNAVCEPVAASDLLREAFQSIEPLALARGLLFELRDDSAGCRLRADRLALAGALLSLLENAVQACAPGARICLSAAVRDAELVFCVSDTGAGIAPEAQARLFEPFFTTRSGGNGLGLAIVRAVAEAHGGTVVARSQPGAGSEFVLHLPLAPAPETRSLQNLPGAVDDVAAAVDS